MTINREYRPRIRGGRDSSRGRGVGRRVVGRGPVVVAVVAAVVEEGVGGRRGVSRVLLLIRRRCELRHEDLLTI